MKKNKPRLFSIFIISGAAALALLGCGLICQASIDGDLGTAMGGITMTVIWSAVVFSQYRRNKLPAPVLAEKHASKESKTQSLTLSEVAYLIAVPIIWLVALALAALIIYWAFSFVSEHGKWEWAIIGLIVYLIFQELHRIVTRLSYIEAKLHKSRPN